MNSTEPVLSIVRSKKGQTLIELTLIVPLMIALVYGVVEIGSIISTYLTITHTTREGANLTSRGTDYEIALDAIISAAAPTMGDNNKSQWFVIYSKVSQDMSQPCPPKPCTYRVEFQETRGNLTQQSQIGEENQTVLLEGIEEVDPHQTFHAIEVFYDYTPNIMTYIGSNLINKIFYDRTIFTNVSNS